jgi:predicted Zn-dependent protease
MNKNCQSKCLVLTNKDIYDANTKYLFACSEINGDSLVVSTYQLQHLNNDIFKMRMLKTVTHEFSHSLDLEHCVNNCCINNGIDSVEELDQCSLLPCIEDCAIIAYSCNRSQRIIILY